MATPVPKDQEEKSVGRVEPFSAEEKERIRQEIWKMRRGITKGGRFRSIAGAARAAEQSGDLRLAAVYYRQLLSLAEHAEGDRPALTAAQAFLNR